MKLVNKVVGGVTKDKYFWLTLATAVLVMGVNWMWVGMNQVEPYYDSAGHTNLAHIYANVMRGRFGYEGVVGILKINNYYPPLIHVLGGLVTLAFGFGYKVLEYFSVLFLGLAGVGLYLYVKGLTKDSWLAFAAAGLFMLMPHVWEQSRYFMLDLPLTALVLWSLYFFEKSEGLSKRGPTGLFLGLAVLAQLTKWYAWLYLLVPVVFGLLSRGKRESWIAKAVVLVLAAGLVVAPWYVVNLRKLVASSVLYSRPDFGDPLTLLSFKNGLFYPILVMNYQVISLGFLGLLGSVYLMLKSQLEWKKMLLWQVGFVYLVFTFLVGNKNLRYVMPLLPFLAFVMGSGLYLLAEKNGRKVGWFVLGGLLGLGWLFMGVSSFGVPWSLEKRIELDLFRGMDRVFLWDTSNEIVGYHWRDDGWNLKGVVDDLVEVSAGELVKVAVVKNDRYVSVAGLRTISLEGKFQSHFINFEEVVYDGVRGLEGGEKVYLEGFDYLLVPEEVVGPVGQVYNYGNLQLLREYVLSGQDRQFELVKSYDLPDGDRLYLMGLEREHNKLVVEIVGEKMILSRPVAPTKVYFQLKDRFEDWSQDVMESLRGRLVVDLSGIRVARVDYPSELMEVRVGESWVYDGDKQFDLKVRE